MYLSSAGGWAPCCVSKLQIPGSAEEVYAGSEFSLLRQDLLNGIKAPSCKSCWLKEEMSARSMRQSYLEMLPETIDPRKNQIEGIRHLDLSFSNICNLKCRFCGPARSDKWNEDANVLLQKDSEFWKEYLPSAPTYPIPRAQELVEFVERLPELTSININGGEPFADPQHKKFLELLAERKLASRLKLLYTTNGSRAPQRELELLSNFHRVEIMVSVEATGELYRYIRGNRFSLEHHVSNHVLKFSKIPNVKLGVFSAMSVYSAWSMVDIFNWIQSMEPATGKLMWQIGVVATPKCLSPFLLPKDIRIKIADSLPNTHPIFSKWNSILRTEDTGPYFEGKEAFSDFLKFNSDLDEIRSESLEKVAPQFFEFMNHEIVNHYD